MSGAHEPGTRQQGTGLPPAGLSTAGLPTNPRKRLRSIAGFVLGVLLLAGAAWFVLREPAQFQETWARCQRAPLWMPLCVLLLPYASWSLTSLMYCQLMNRGLARDAHQRVGTGEMHALLASAWLMNYLPMRPGMFGRIAYHVAVNGVPVSRAIGASIIAVVLGASSTFMLLASALAFQALGTPGQAWAACCALMPLVLTLAVGMVALRTSEHRALALALALRYADVLTWMARYFLLFRMLERPLSLSEAAAFTAVSQAAAMVPLVGNGMGVREWANGLLGPILPAWARLGSVANGALTGAIAQQISLGAELIHRVLEFVACLPVGLVCGLWVAKKLRHCAAQRAPERA